MMEWVSFAEDRDGILTLFHWRNGECAAVPYWGA
jgi:hypothetical protein